MVSHIIILILTCLCLCSCQDDYIKHSSGELLTESITPEDNMKLFVSHWMEKTDNKLEKFESNIKNYIDLKFYKMFDKFEEYFNNKLKTLQNEIEQKIDVSMNALRKTLPAVEQNITHQLDVIEKKIEENKPDKCDTLDKQYKKSELFEETNRKIDKLRHKIPSVLERNIYHKLKAIEKKLPEIENNLTSQLDRLDKNITVKLEKELASCGKLEAMPTNFADLDEKLITKCNELEQKILPNIKENMHYETRTNFDIDGNLTNKLNASKSLNENLLKTIKQTQEWNCRKEERVPNTRYIYGEKLHPLSDATGSGGAGGGAGGGGGVHLRFALRGEDDSRIFLSPEQGVHIKHGLHFTIVIGESEATLFVHDAGDSKTIQHVSVDTGLSFYQDTRVVLSIADDSLQVHVGDAALLVGRDPRVAQIQYFGFDTVGSSKDFAIFKYGC